MASGEEALLTGKGERGGRCQPGKPGRGVHRQLLLLLVLAIRQGLTSYDGSHGWLLSAVEQPLQNIRLHNAISVTQQFSTSMRETIPKRVLSWYATCRGIVLLTTHRIGKIPPAEFHNLHKVYPILELKARPRRQLTCSF